MADGVLLFLLNVYSGHVRRQELLGHRHRDAALEVRHQPERRRNLVRQRHGRAHHPRPPWGRGLDPLFWEGEVAPRF